MRRILSAIAIVLLVSAACGDDGESAPTSSSTTSSTTTITTTTTDDGGSIVVQVFFLDEDAFNIGRLPYTRPVDRTVAAGEPEAAALDELFRGPTAEEGVGGLRFVASEATGIAELSIEDRTAHVHLAGGCSSGGSTFSVANHIVPTLLQFTSVDVVKIYDPAGETGSPNEPGDSIPLCLEP